MATVSVQLNSTTILTPAEREHHKTVQQRAEDVIYTLNHAITCLSLTDFLIAPAIGALSTSLFGEKNRIDICGHDHASDKLKPAQKPESQFLSKLTQAGAQEKGKMRYGKVTVSGKAVDAILAQEQAKIPFFKRMGNWLKTRSKEMGRWVVGEAVGDVGAVFVTVGVQRFFPGFMDSLQKMIEPVFGGMFHRGADRAAHKWADRHALAYDSQQVVDRAQELYQYEIRHLPQMAVWTVASAAINYGVMKAMDPKMPFMTFAKGKAIGSAVTAGLVFGARAIAPDKAHKWDETAGKHVVVPLTKSVGKLFGVKERDVDAYHARQSENESPQSWAARVREPLPTVEVSRQA